MHISLGMNPVIFSDACFLKNNAENLVANVIVTVQKNRNTKLGQYIINY